MVKPINHYSLENPATVYDEVAMTTLQLAARTAAKVNECVGEVNKIPDVVDDALQEAIDNGTFDKKMDEHYESLVAAVEEAEKAIQDAEDDLGQRLDNLLGSVEEGSTTLDAEVIDARQDNNGGVWPNAGANIRMMQKETAALLDVLSRDVLTDVSKTPSAGWYGENGTFNEHEGYRCFSLDVAPGDVYHYGGIYGYDVRGAICLDAAGAAVKTWFTKTDGASTHYFADPIIIPPTGAKLLVNSGVDSAGRFASVPCLMQVSGREMNMNPLSSYLENALAPLNNGENLYVDAGERRTSFYLSKYGWETADTTGKYEVIVAEVKPGETYRIRCETHYENGLYALCNEAGYPVECLAGTSTDGSIDTVEKTVVIPQGVAQLRVAGMPSFAGAKGALCQKLVERRCHTGGVWSHLKWACIGDSLTEENTKTDKHYFDYIQEKTGIQVVNLGQSGLGYAQPITRNGFDKLATSVPDDCDVVTIFGSGNDAGSELGVLTDNLLSSQTVCGALNYIITRITRDHPNVKLGIVSPTPWYGQHPIVDGCWMTEYVEALKAVCELRGIPFLDLYHLSGFQTTNADGTINTACHDTFFSKDDEGVSTHPNEVGHKHLSSHFYAFLQSLIGTY